jgi:hypothetical protein
VTVNGATNAVDSAVPVLNQGRTHADFTLGAFDIIGTFNLCLSVSGSSFKTFIGTIEVVRLRSLY